MLKISKEIPIENLVSRQLKFWENVSQVNIETGAGITVPCITISREIGSQGAELALKLAERLGWQVFDKEIVDYIANHAKVRKNIVELFDGKARSEFNTWMLTMLDSHSLSSDRFFKHLVTTILSIGQHGRVIILGRGGNFILPDNKALKLRVVAPLRQRVEYVRIETGSSAAQAEATIKKMQNERNAFVKRYFRTKPDAAQHYDLTLNMGKMNLQTAEAAVVGALTAKFGFRENIIRNTSKKPEMKHTAL